MTTLCAYAELTFRHIDLPLLDCVFDAKAIALWQTMTTSSMAFKPIRMHQIRQLIGFLSTGYTYSDIVRLTGIARYTIKGYKRRIENQGLTYEQLLALDDEALAQALQGEKGRERIESEQTRLKDLQGRMEYFKEELRRRGVTMQLLWDEYREENPQGYGYTQFCEHLARYRKIHRVPSCILHIGLQNNYWSILQGTNCIMSTGRLANWWVVRY